MNIEEKIGQLFMVPAVSDEVYNQKPWPGSNLPMDYNFMQRSPYTMDKEYITKLIKEYHVGGIIFLRHGTIEKQIKRTNYFQQQTKTPLLIGQDLEWGLAMRLDDGIAYPKAGKLAHIKNNQIIYELGKEIGRQAKLLGVHINFAPVADINSNPHNPVIGDRAFGSDKENVAQKAIAFMNGLHAAGVIACAKHFPGHGDTQTDSHEVLPKIDYDKKKLYDQELYPFKKMIESGVKMVMLAHLEVAALEKEAGLPSTLSKSIVTNVLKKELGFDGLVITDGLGMKALTNSFAHDEIALKALQAGVDILLCCVDVPTAVAKIKSAIEDGFFSEKDLNKRVLKILKLKEKLLCERGTFFIAEDVAGKINTPSANEIKNRLDLLIFL